MQQCPSALTKPRPFPLGPWDQIEASTGGHVRCGTAKRVYIARHATSLCNVMHGAGRGTNKCPSDPPLAAPDVCRRFQLHAANCSGPAEARMAGARLPLGLQDHLQVLVVSPLQRAVLTALLLFAQYSGALEV